jgi:hypothetical protein
VELTAEAGTERERLQLAAAQLPAG